MGYLTLNQEKLWLNERKCEIAELIGVASETETLL
jgi:hypothetical protein